MDIEKTYRIGDSEYPVRWTGAQSRFQPTANNNHTIPGWGPICGLILLALALNSEATAPVQLSGSNSLAILNQIAHSVQTINTSTNTGLWNWGNIPIGYSLNKSGILNPLQTVLSNDYGDWTPSIGKLFLGVWTTEIHRQAEFGGSQARVVRPYGYKLKGHEYLVFDKKEIASAKPVSSK